MGQPGDETLRLLDAGFAGRTFLGYAVDVLVYLAIKFHQPSPWPPLGPGPSLRPTAVRVVRMDTITAALGIARADADPPPLIVNFGNPATPGHVWIHGGCAQEECIFLRSSASRSVKPSHFPLAQGDLIYSPFVAVVRHDTQHASVAIDLPPPPAPPPAVSMLTVTVEKSPRLAQDTYASTASRDAMARTMQFILHTAAALGHTKLVLGALGCGVYRHPPKVVASLWHDALASFAPHGQHWWEDVVFAVMSAPGNTNYDVFHDALHGVAV